MTQRIFSAHAPWGPGLSAPRTSMGRGSVGRLGALVLAGAASGCGLEGIFAQAASTDHQRPRATLRGSVDGRLPAPLELERARFEILTAAGAEVEIFDVRVDGNRFDLGLDQARYPNARLSVSVGGFNLLALVPEIARVDGESEFDSNRGLVPTEVLVTRESTIEALVMVGKVTSLGRTLQSLDPLATRNTLARIGEELAAGTSTLARVASVVDQLLDRADPLAETSTSTPVVFQWPEYQPDGLPIARALVQGTPVIEEGVDFGLATPSRGEVARLRFDQLVEAAGSDIPLQECLDPELVRVVLEVDFNDGRLDGNCTRINRFKWVRDEPGKSMWFVGGIHMESPIQDTEIDGTLGNQGSWRPNIIPMFDDGASGDAVAGDNIWTITFDLPRGLRIGYKFTWGQKGDLWTGAEEWPGNQRLLEVVDVNDDGFVYRRDNFGDEATNKDLANQRIGVGGVLTWTTDADRNGIPDVQERHDLTNDCRPDPLTTPTGIGPATVPPNPDGTCPVRQ